MESPSKSQLKREATALQEIAVALSSLPIKQIMQFTLPEKLYAAIIEYKQIADHRALHRQAKYLGKIMRDIELEVLQQIFKQVPKLPHQELFKL